MTMFSGCSVSIYYVDKISVRRGVKTQNQNASEQYSDRTMPMENFRSVARSRDPVIRHRFVCVNVNKCL